MEKQLKQFFDFLENEKKVSDNTLQSYRRDLDKFKDYMDNNGKKYNKIKENDVKEYIDFLLENNRKPSTVLRTIASIRSFYQYEIKVKKVTERE